jgi:hypothetical protein
MAALASKSQSQKIFEKLRTKPANRVSMPHVKIGYGSEVADEDANSRYASIAGRRIQHGPPYLSVSISA